MRKNTSLIKLILIASIWSGVCGSAEDAQFLESVDVISEHPMVPTMPIQIEFIGVPFEANKGIELYKKKSAKFLGKAIRTGECFYLGTALGYHLFVAGPVDVSDTLTKIEKRWAVSAKEYRVTVPVSLSLPRRNAMLIRRSELKKVQSVQKGNKTIICR